MGTAGFPHGRAGMTGGATSLPGSEVMAPGRERLTACRPPRVIVDDDLRRETRLVRDGSVSPSRSSIIVHWVSVAVIFLALLGCLVATRIGIIQIGRCGAIASLSTRQGGKGTMNNAYAIKTEDNGNRTHDQPNKNMNDAQDVAALFFLILSALVPYSLTFVRSVWRGMRPDRLWPSYKSIALGIFGAVMESTGVSLFLVQFLFMSKFPYLILSTGASGVFLVPSLVAMVALLRSGSRGKRVRLFCLFLSPVLCVAGILLTVRPWVDDSDLLTHFVSFLLPVALLSLVWSPALLRRQLVPSRRQVDELQRAHQTIDRLRGRSEPPYGEATLDLEAAVVMDPTLNARWKSSIVTSFVKVVAVPLICALLLSNLPSKPLTFADVREGFEKMNVNHVAFPWFLVTILCGLGSYAFGRIACVIRFKKQCFATALGLASALSLIVAGATFDGAVDIDVFCVVGAVCLAIAQFAAAIGFAWETQPIAMQKESQVFWLPGYNGLFVDQWLLLDSRGPPSVHPPLQLDPVERARRTRILICSTMYRETLFEMKQLLESFDEINVAKQRSDRDVQAHIFLDNGVRETRLSDFSLQLISAIEDSLDVVCEDCTKVMTPYGLRLTWELPSVIQGKLGMILTLHLKDSLKVKSKKRWSQVMYMSYVLDYIVPEEGASDDDVFILTTDADVRFSPESVESLLDLMIRDPCVGAVSARTFPKGSGPIYWYQIFDYAIGHWLQKAAEHVLGTVLCSPGCFSVYRAAALRDVLPIYCSEVKCASEFLTKDMGEDRWLCTLMIQSGWMLEYCAAAGISTCCPVEFNEFFRQRRRWIPSTLANQIVLLREWHKVATTNRQVSRLFMVYEAILLFSTLANPSVCILIVVGGLFYAWNANMVATLVIMLLITIGYLLVCLYGSQELQLKVAKVLTYVFALVMVAVVIGAAAQLVDENLKNNYTKLMPSFGQRTTSATTNTTTTTTRKSSTTPTSTHQSHWRSQNSIRELLEVPPEMPVDGDVTGWRNVTTTSHPLTTTSSRTGSDGKWELPLPPSTIFLAMLAGIFILTALVHPSEAYCLLHGVWFLLCLPSSSILMMIYSICNITERSWGTREEKTIEDIGGTASVWGRISAAIRGIVRGDSRTSSPTPGPETSKDPHLGTAEEGCPESDHDIEEPGVGKAERGYYRNRARTVDNQFHSEGLNYSPKRTRDWLPADLAHLYGSAFEENGYENTSFVASMTESDLISIGVRSKAHQCAIIRAVKLLPAPDMEPGVPSDVRGWLRDIGLAAYYPNFCEAHIITPRSLVEVLKRMTRREIKKELRITKQGHLKHLILALTKLRHPTELEKWMIKVKLEIDALYLFELKDVNRNDFDFWEQLRHHFLQPDTTFSQELDLRAELVSLRNQSIMCFGLVNFMWIILIMTLLSATQLDVLQTNIPGLVFLCIFAIIIVVQFISMLIHRCTTWSHMIARSPSRFGDPYNVNFDFSDLNLSGGAFAVDPPDLEQSISDVHALEHKREVNAAQRSRYINFIAELASRRHSQIDSNDQERQGLLASHEEFGGIRSDNRII